MACFVGGGYLARPSGDGKERGKERETNESID